MAAKITFKSGNSLGLTERCADVAGFMKSIGSGRLDELQAHLTRCPACRKVALDAVVALTSQGELLEPPSVVQQQAGKQSSADDGEVVTIGVRAAGSGEMDGSGAPFERIGRDGRLRFRIDAGGKEIVLELESDHGLFHLRAFPAGAVDAVAVLRSGSGEPILPARKFSSPLAWPALASGEYSFVAAGRDFRKEIVLRLALKP